MTIAPSRPLSRRALLGAAAAIPAGALAACGADRPAAPGGPPVELTYLTSFGSLGRDSYAHLALRNGTFAGAGLVVDVEPGAGTAQNLQALLAGQADFVCIDLAGAAITRATQRGFIAIAAIHQRPLSAVMAYLDSGIRAAADLSGRRVGLPTGAVTGLLFPSYLESAGIPPAEVEQVELEPSGLVPALASGQVDAIGQFAVGRPLVAAAGGGREVTVLPYDEYLPDLYGVGLLTTVERVERDPALCGRFRDALLRGLQAAIDSPAAAGDALAAYHPEVDPGIAAAELELMRPYSQVGEAGLPLGHIDRSRLARHIALLTTVGLLGSGPPLQPEDLAAFALVPGATP